MWFSQDAEVGVKDHGVGTLLLAAAVASARLRGVRCIVGWVMGESSAMRHLPAASHRRLRLGWEGSVARYELEVPPAMPGRAAA